MTGELLIKRESRSGRLLWIKKPVLSLFACCRAGVRVGPLLKPPPVLPWALPQQEHLEEHVCARLHLVSHPHTLDIHLAAAFFFFFFYRFGLIQYFIFFCSSTTLFVYSLFFCPSSLRFISHGISHCYSSFRGDVRGTAPSFYWTYLLSVCAGGGAWLLLWVTVDRCGRRGILLLSMTMTGLASLILLGLMECKRAFVGSRDICVLK